MKEVAAGTTTEFNPMQDVPVNDEQATIALCHERPAFLADNLCEIYRCLCELGLSVPDAYKETLYTWQHCAASPGDDEEVTQ